MPPSGPLPWRSRCRHRGTRRARSESGSRPAEHGSHTPQGLLRALHSRPGHGQLLREVLVQRVRGRGFPQRRAKATSHWRWRRRTRAPGAPLPACDASTRRYAFGARERRASACERRFNPTRSTPTSWPTALRLVCSTARATASRISSTVGSLISLREYDTFIPRHQLASGFRVRAPTLQKRPHSRSANPDVHRRRSQALGPTARDTASRSSSVVGSSMPAPRCVVKRKGRARARPSPSSLFLHHPIPGAPQRRRRTGPLPRVCPAWSAVVPA